MESSIVFNDLKQIVGTFIQGKKGEDTNVEELFKYIESIKNVELSDDNKASIVKVVADMLRGNKPPVNMESTSTSTINSPIQSNNAQTPATAKPVSATHEPTFVEEDSMNANGNEDEPDAPIKKPGKRGRKPLKRDDDDDEPSYYRKKQRALKKKAAAPVKDTTPESEGMLSLRAYTSALKMGPRCFRGLLLIEDMTEREDELIRRLHEGSCSWNERYPSNDEIEAAKEITRKRKEQKRREPMDAMQMDPDAPRTSRKAAEKAREFLKKSIEFVEDEQEEGNEGIPNPEIGNDEEVDNEQEEFAEESFSDN